MASQPEADPDAFTPATAMPTATVPDATAHPSPHAPVSAPTAAPAPMMMAMRDQFHLGRIVPLEHRHVRLVEFVQDSIAGGNTGNRLAGSGQAGKCRRPPQRQAVQSETTDVPSKPPSCRASAALPSPATGSSEPPIGLNVLVAFSFHHPTSRKMKSCSILAAGESTRFLTVIRL
jgi:hypothetical protein